MDVKGDNIFIDATGDWVLGDFGSCKRKGDIITSTTTIFYYENILGEVASEKYDYFMLFVVLMFETLSNKHSFESKL